MSREKNDLEMKNLVQEVSKLVSSLAGIYLGEKQSHMVESRLRGRMMKLGVDTAQEYRRFYAENKDSETHFLVSLMTTHHSFFFREYVHFEHLASILPQLVKRAKKRGDHKIRVWSAACSRGQEVYSLAMFLDQHLPTIDKDVTYEVMGSDIDSISVKTAQNGVYKKNEISEVPLNYLQKYFSKGTGDIADFVRLTNQIREKCKFEVINLTKVPDMAEKFDVIFCRNVFIYFDEKTLEQCANALISKLQGEGYLYLGTSETLGTIDTSLKNHGASVYSTAKTSENSFSRELLKVFCVDDSPSILKILRNILTAEHGFEVIGTALNGVEAVRALENLQADIVTLDLHMPVMDGFGFLQEYKGDAKVMVVSSVAKDDKDTLSQLESLGIEDYVEKPSIVNLQKHSEEIRTKARSLMDPANRKVNIKKALSVFSDRSVQTDHRHIHYFVKESNLDRYIHILSDSEPGFPPVFLWLPSGSDVQKAVDLLSLNSDLPVKKFSENPKSGEIYIGDLRADLPIVFLKNDKKNRHLAIVGKEPEHELLTVLRRMRSGFVVLEEDTEGGVVYRQIQVMADDIMPRSSFRYFIKKWCREDFEDLAG